MSLGVLWASGECVVWMCRSSLSFMCFTWLCGFLSVGGYLRVGGFVVWCVFVVVCVGGGEGGVVVAVIFPGFRGCFRVRGLFTGFLDGGCGGWSSSQRVCGGGFLVGPGVFGAVRRRLRGGMWFFVGCVQLRFVLGGVGLA